MSILDGLRKERGRQSSTSAAASRRRVLRPSKNRLPADRIAAALGTTRVAPPGPPRHSRVPGSPIDETVPPVSAQRRRRPLKPERSPRAPVVPAPVDVANGRHRRPAPSHRRAPSAPRGSLGIQAHLRLFVAVGVVALVIAVAMMIGVRVVVSRSSAQTQLVATTTHQPVAAPTAKAAVGTP